MSSPEKIGEVITIFSDDDTQVSENVVVVVHPQRQYAKKDKVVIKTGKIVKIKIEKKQLLSQSKQRKRNVKKMMGTQPTCIQLGKQSRINR
jgi:hypothetical protein